MHRHLISLVDMCAVDEVTSVVVSVYIITMTLSPKRNIVDAMCVGASTNNYRESCERTQCKIE